MDKEQETQAEADKRGHHVSFWLTDAEQAALRRFAQTQLEEIRGKLDAAQRSALKEITAGTAARIALNRFLFSTKKKPKR